MFDFRFYCWFPVETKLSDEEVSFLVVVENRWRFLVDLVHNPPKDT